MNQTLSPKDEPSCELDTSFIHENGVKRNLIKFKYEWIWLTINLKDDWKRFKNSLKPWNWMDFSHALVNLFTESMRCSPYLIAHIVAIGALLQLMLFTSWWFF